MLDYYFVNSCDGTDINNNCQERFIKDYISYDSSNLFVSKSDDKSQKIPDKYNLNTTEFHTSVELMLKYSKEIDPNVELLRPNVASSIVYSSFLDTKTSFLYNKDQKDKLFSQEQIYFHGGDGTVTTYSSLLPALKWYIDAQSEGIIFI